MSLTDIRCCHLLLLFVTFWNICSGQECSTYYQCDACIVQNSSCAWCNSKTVFDTQLELSEAVSPVSLCGTPEELVGVLGCPSEDVINPSSSFDSEGDTGVVVRPSNVDVTLRPGVPITVPLTVEPPKNLAVDMYLLLDLTWSMRSNILLLSTLGSDLINIFTNMSSDFRVGFGSFVDKTIAPFGEILDPDFPCHGEGVSTPDNCRRAYTFRHQLSFTNNYTEFLGKLEELFFSASYDSPESILDAMLQSAVCTDEIGWSSDDSRRRIIMSMTDGDYHIALDGKLGGLLQRPEKDCQLNDRLEYMLGDQRDYSSVSMVAGVLQEERIIPIFLTQGPLDSYKQLIQDIPNAVVSQLGNNREVLLQRIEEAYLKSIGAVVPLVIGRHDLLSLSVVPSNCTLAEDTTDVCEGVLYPASVVYDATFSIDPEYCQQGGKPPPISVRIQFTGFGETDFIIQPVCEPCTECTSMAEPGSATCSGNGTFECSTCVCDLGYQGPNCGCQTGGVLTLCRPNVFVEECSGNGQCTCGKCKCDEGFVGDFCSCEERFCPVGAGGAICSGQGKCNCDKCECNPGFTGNACGCTTENTTCLNKLSGSVCTDAGSCTCGVCICSNYSERIGDFCETCLPCASSCSRVVDCVSCLTIGGRECSSDCSHIEIVSDKTEVPNYQKISFKNCSLALDGCEVLFQMDDLVLGTEDVVYAVLSPDQSDYDKLRNDPGSCGAGLLIWPIPVGIVLGIILVGIVAIVVWKLLSLANEYLEYRQWMKSVREETSRSGSNPLFVDPTSRYQNPRYKSR